MRRSNDMQSVANPSVVLKDIWYNYYEKVSRFGNRHRIQALRGINSVVQIGETVGLLGANGSGKSTLCRVIAGAVAPSAGTVMTNGEPHLMGVSAALVPNLTGEQNIELGLLAMGVHRDRIASLVPQITEMVGIGDAITRPLSTYSSGMSARLKFAIGTSVPSRILLIDEALSTGDSTFTLRAEERMSDLLDRSGTIFLVSHNAKQINRVCSRAIWLDQGRVVADADAKWVSRQYEVWAYYKSRKEYEKASRIMEYASANYKPPMIEVV